MILAIDFNNKPRVNDDSLSMDGSLSVFSVSYIHKHTSHTYTHTNTHAHAQIHVHMHANTQMHLPLSKAMLLQQELTGCSNLTLLSEVSS